MLQPLDKETFDRLAIKCDYSSYYFITKFENNCLFLEGTKIIKISLLWWHHCSYTIYKIWRQDFGKIKTQLNW